MRDDAIRLLPDPLNTRALSTRRRRADVRRTWRALKAERRGGDLVGDVRRAATTIGGVLGLAVFPVMTAAAAAFLREGTAESMRQFWGIGSFALIMTIATAVLLRTAVKLWARRTSATTHVKLATLADDNGLEYFAGPIGPQRGGPWLGRGALNLSRVLRTRRVHDPGQSTRAGRLPEIRLEIADYEIFGNRRNTAPQFGGYVAIRLPAPLPHLVLRAQDGPRRLISSAAVPVGAQRLGLEGDFDSYFHLYCPAGYERDALYLFSPDVMARLLDHARGLDVEIVDDWMILASPRILVTASVTRWRAIAEVFDALDDRIQRWGRWRDEHGTPAPAPGGTGGVDASAVVRRDADDHRSLPEASRGRRLRLRPGGDVAVIAIVTALFVASVVAANLV